MNMRVLVIGGTSGIGASIVKVFKDNGHEVTATGRELDIGSESARHHLVYLMNTADTIVNCAYSGSNQRELLFKAFDEYKDQNKIFINIESANAWREGQLTVDQIAYVTDKLALVTARRHLQKLPRQMKIIGICPATVDTKYNASKNIPKMKVDSVAIIIYNAVTTVLEYGIELSEIHMQAC